MQHLRRLLAPDLQAITNVRPGETKLGERLLLDWQAPSVRCVLLGIAEDIGVRANLGVGGTRTAWAAFLASFVNVQSTEQMTGAQVGVYGYFDFAEWQHQVSFETVAAMDAEISEAVQEIVAAGKFPIVIGGGHNNAYPILKGVSTALGQPLHCVNLDAHSDFRLPEGRHSGNGFRYAYQAGFLQKYAVVGLHENYNAANIMAEFRTNADLWSCFWEDIALREQWTFPQAVHAALDFTQGAPTGIELDLDCVENVLASARTPCGWSPTQARQYLHWATQTGRVAYVHLCEGASQLDTGEAMPSLGKLLAYLVSDVVKGIG